MEVRFSAEQVVEALYRGVLGRAPDTDGLRHHAEGLRQRGPVEVVRAMVECAEFRHLLGLEHQPRIALLGNCVAPVLAACLRNSCAAWTRWVADVNHEGSPPYEAAVAAINAGLADIVISVPFGEFYPALSSSRLKGLYGDKFLTVTSIHFTGLHPDLTYFGSFRRRFHSPLGDYHSRIALLCYLNGIGQQDCLARFNATTYKRQGYFDAFEASATELRRRDAAVDIRFAETFVEATRHVQTLYSVNHPTSTAIVALAGCIADHLGVAGRFAADRFSNALSDGARWPIYPEVREANRLPYETEFLFRGGTHAPAYTLEEFVAGSYRAYEAYGRQVLLDEARNSGFLLPGL